MRWGSGTNLKMLDYALAGMPIVSTAFGARGLGLEAGAHYEAGRGCSRPGCRRCGRCPRRRSRSARAPPRERVRERFAWDAIAARWHAHPALRELLEGAAVA